MNGIRNGWIVRLVVVLACASLCAVLSGCGGKQKTDEDNTDEVKETPESGSQTQSADEQPEQAEDFGDTRTADEPADSDEPEQAKSKETFDRSTESSIEAAVDQARSGDTRRALKKLERMVDGDGGYLAAYNMGVVQESEGATRKAASRYQQALKKNPDFSPALLNLVRLYLRMGQTSDADSLARKYMDRRPENMSHRAAHLEVDLHKGQYEEAIRASKKILRRDEKNVDAMLAMAEANMALERFELAQAILDRAMELEPDRAEIYFKYGAIRDQQDNPSGAIESYQKATDLRPDYPEAHNNLGVLYHEARDYASAVSAFNSTIKWAPGFEGAYLNKGNSLKGQGKFKKAAAAFEKALEIDPDFADAYFNLGILYMDSDFEGLDKIPELRKAIDYFEKYKAAKSGRTSEDDPISKYLQEAKKAIEVEKQRQEMMRQQQQQP